SCYEEVKRLRITVPDQFAAGVKRNSLCVNSENYVFATINRSAQFIRFHLVNCVGAQNAMLDVLWLKITFLNKELHFLRVVILSRGVAARLPSTAPLPGGRRLAAARSGVSDCAGFAPNIKQKRLALTALSLTPCHPPSSSVSSLRPCRLVFPRCRSSERKNKP